MSEDHKAILQAKFFAKKSKEFEDLLYKTKMELIKLRGDEITYEREFKKYNRKLRDMVVQI